MDFLAQWESLSHMHLLALDIFNSFVFFSQFACDRLHVRFQISYQPYAKKSAIAKQKAAQTQFKMLKFLVKLSLLT